MTKFKIKISAVKVDVFFRNGEYPENVVAFFVMAITDHPNVFPFVFLTPSAVRYVVWVEGEFLSTYLAVWVLSVCLFPYVFPMV